MCAKLRTVAASNNRDRPTRSLYCCLFAPPTYIFVLRAHPVRGESHNQHNTTGEVATKPHMESASWRCAACQDKHLVSMSKVWRDFIKNGVNCFVHIGTTLRVFFESLAFWDCFLQLLLELFHVIKTKLAYFDIWYARSAPNLRKCSSNGIKSVILLQKYKRFANLSHSHWAEDLNVRKMGIPWNYKTKFVFQKREVIYDLLVGNRRKYNYKKYSVNMSHLWMLTQVLSLIIFTNWYGRYISIWAENFWLEKRSQEVCSRFHSYRWI